MTKNFVKYLILIIYFVLNIFFILKPLKNVLNVLFYEQFLLKKQNLG